MVKCIHNPVGSNSEAYSDDREFKVIAITDIKTNPT